MTWLELSAARQEFSLTQHQMSMLLRVGLSTYKGWGVRGKVPDYIAASVEAHFLLSKAMPGIIQVLINQRHAQACERS